MFHPLKGHKKHLKTSRKVFHRMTLRLKRIQELENKNGEIIKKWILNKEKKNLTYDERDEVGKFYYRFENGESGADVYDRVSLFYDTLYREMDSVN